MYKHEYNLKNTLNGGVDMSLIVYNAEQKETICRGIQRMSACENINCDDCQLRNSNNSGTIEMTLNIRDITGEII